MSSEHAWLEAFSDPAALVDASGRIAAWNARGRLLFEARLRLEVVTHGRAFGLGDLAGASLRAGQARAASVVDPYGRAWRLRLEPMPGGESVVVLFRPARDDVRDEPTADVFSFVPPRRVEGAPPPRTGSAGPADVVKLHSPPPRMPVPRRELAPPTVQASASDVDEVDQDDEATVIEPYKLGDPRRAQAAPEVGSGSHDALTTAPPPRQDARRDDAESASPRERLAHALARSIGPLLVRDDVEAAIREGLATVGRATSADRCFVVLLAPDVSGVLRRRERIAWAADGIPLTAPSNAGASSFGGVPARWARVLGSGGTLDGRVDTFPPDERMVLTRYGVRSTAIVPIRAEGRLLGFLGLDDCRAARVWSLGEKEILRGVADGFAGALRRRDTARSLRVARDRYEAAVRGAELALWEVDASTGAVLHLDGVDTLLGLDQAELPRDVVGFLGLLHEADRAPCRAAVQAHLARQADRVDLEVRLAAAGGWKWVALRGKVTDRGPGGVPGRAHGTLVDIHERKRLLEQVRTARAVAEAANEAKSRFLANMSHEVRTPLNAVLGMATLLEGTALSADQSDLVATLRESGEHLLGLINQVLDLTEIESGRMAFEVGAVDVRDLLLDVAGAYRERAEARGLTLDVRLDDPLPSRAGGDRARIRQVIVALVDNAVKFTERGGVRLEAWCPDASDPYLLRVEVADSGMGIPADRLATLYDPFALVDGSDARQHQGSGLGLSVARKLCELMGGRLEAESTPSVGSVFRFHLRLLDLGSAGETASATALPADLRVMVVEDNVVNQKVAVGMLSRLGCKADVRESGADAVEAVLSAPPDVVLMDIQMPGMDGLEATRRIREQQGSGTTPWIIALTAAAQTVDRQRSLESGMNDYLAKPVRLDELERALSRAVAVSRGS